MEQPCREPTPRTPGQPDATRLQDLVEDLHTPVVVINAYVQIIQRRILREPDLDPRDLLDHLAVIERSTHRLDARLRAAERDASRTRAGHTRSGPRRAMALRIALPAMPPTGQPSGQISCSAVAMRLLEQPIPV